MAPDARLQALTTAQYWPLYSYRFRKVVPLQDWVVSGCGSFRTLRTKVASKPHASTGGLHPDSPSLGCEQATWPHVLIFQKAYSLLCYPACILASQARPSRRVTSQLPHITQHTFGSRAPGLPGTQSIWSRTIPATEPAGCAPLVAHKSLLRCNFSASCAVVLTLDLPHGGSGPQAQPQDALANSLVKCAVPRAPPLYASPARSSRSVCGCGGRHRHLHRCPNSDPQQLDR